MPTSVKTGSSISSGFTGTSVARGFKQMGSIGAISTPSASKLGSKISSFGIMAASPERSVGGATGISRSDMRVDKAGFSAFKTTRPTVRFIGNINSRTISQNGENNSVRPRSIGGEPRKADKKGFTPVLEKNLIAFQPNSPAKGAERFGIFPSRTRAKGLEQFQNLPHINFVDKTRSTSSAEVKASKPVMEITSRDRTEPILAIDQSKPVTRYESKQVVDASKAGADHLTNIQVRSLMALEPLVALGILSKTEAKSRVGVIDYIDQEAEKKKQLKKQSETTLKSQNGEKVADTQASLRAIDVLPAIEPNPIEARAQELVVLMQTMQGRALQEQLAPVAQAGQSASSQIVAERATRLAEKLSEKTASATIGETPEPVAQLVLTRLKKVVKILTKKQSTPKESVESENNQQIKTYHFQEDKQAEKARIEYAKYIKDKIVAEKRAAGMEDISVTGKEVYDRLPLTEEMRGKVIRQKGQDVYIEDGTSIAVRDGYKDMAEVTDESIVLWNTTTGVRPVEAVEGEITTTASDKQEVITTFRQQHNPNLVVITESDDQIMGVETTELVTSQSHTSALPKKDLPSNIEEIPATEGMETIPAIDHQLELINRAFLRRSPFLYQRLARVLPN